MPRGDGTGPPGGGRPGSGRGVGRGSGGAGRMSGDQPGAGPSGYCICPACGKRIAHQVGSPCNNIRCPDCGAKMTRG